MHSQPGVELPESRAVEGGEGAGCAIGGDEFEGAGQGTPLHPGQHEQSCFSLVKNVPVNYAFRFSGPVTALTARRVRYGGSKRVKRQPNVRRFTSQPHCSLTTPTFTMLLLKSCRLPVCDTKLSTSQIFDQHSSPD
jgi:hypothetical protein